MAFNLTPVDAPVAKQDTSEYDEAVQATIALADKGQWASITVDDEKSATSFKRKFRDAARRADKSGRFTEDVTGSDGKVTLSFTVGAKIDRPRAPKDETAETETETPATPAA